ncbi:phage holin family protein [Trueperella pecoris]|uniref:Phage holin family protein n=1 Tax=Trueperella pecoris TaxID=2733571 RepID=A0A7M1R0L1_9ACTO|nr:phage holin family protein [Trueperella pecoris]QOR47872.1 phage holin family protein [Trueperella pecoris]
MSFLIGAVVNAVALWVTTQLFSGIRLEGTADAALASLGTGEQMAVYFLLAGVVLGVVNMVVRPVVKLLSLPFYILTLGLFFIVVNALMLLLTSWITGYFAMSLVIDSFGWALVGGLVVGLVNWALNLVIPDRD